MADFSEKVLFRKQKIKILKKKIFFPKIQISIKNVSKYELVWSTDKKVGRRDKMLTLAKKAQFLAKIHKISSFQDFGSQLLGYLQSFENETIHTSSRLSRGPEKKLNLKIGEDVPEI